MNEKTIKLLQLTKQELKVLEALSVTDGKNVSTISRQSKVPRMTVYLMLNSLSERGLIYFSRKGRRRFWQKLSMPEFSTLLSQSSRHLHDNKSKIEITHSENSGVTVLRGLDNLFEIFKKIASGHKGQRLIGIQSTSSMKYVINKLTWNRIKPIQDAIKNNKIIVQGLLRNDYYPSMISLFKNPKQKREVLNSVIGRATDMVFVGNEYLNTDSELMMFNNVAFLINWKDEIALEIKNPDILNLFIELFELASGYGKKVDQNSYLNTIINEIDLKK